MVMISEIKEKMNTLIRIEYEQLTADLLLNDFQKTLFKMKYVDKLSIDDIANELYISKFRVNKELFILRQKLAKLPIFQSNKLDVTTATELQIRDKCRKLGKSKEYADFCVLAFVDKLSNKKLAEIFILSVKTIKAYKTNRKKELEM